MPDEMLDREIEDLGGVGAAEDGGARLGIDEMQHADLVVLA